MKLTFDASVEAFRGQFLAWLGENKPAAEEMAADPVVSSAHIPDWASRWTRRMFDAGWLVPGWPPELGGRNATAIQTLVYQEELTKAHIPRTSNPQGLGIIAPSILDYGNEEQIRDYAMPILRGERAACLGMSEPGAGSDLAALSTRAVLDGDLFVINGQKVWTSGANYADFCFLFCRTDQTAAKHQGITTYLALTLTSAALCFLYGLTSVMLTHFLAARFRSNPGLGRALEKIAGLCLVGFGIKLAVSK